MRKRERFSIEFSKKILIFVSIATTAIVTASFVLMYITGDLSPLSYILTGIFAELASATGFYYWKARRENEIKLKYLYPDCDLERVDMEDAKG